MKWLSRALLLPVLLLCTFEDKQTLFCIFCLNFCSKKWTEPSVWKCSIKNRLCLSDFFLLDNILSLLSLVFVIQQFLQPNYFSMFTYCRNKNTCYLTKVNFITEDEMLRNTYSYENWMFTNNVRCSIIQGSKGKTAGEERKVLALNKSLIYIKVEKCVWGRYERLIKVDWIFSADILDQHCPTLSPIATCGDRHF